jgi:hypothetical protein
MANKIYMDTELMEQLGSQIAQLQHSLSSIQQSLSGSVAEVRRVASGQTGIINKLSAVQKNTQKAAEHTGKLARAVRTAAGNWEEAEKRVASQQLPEIQNPNSNGGTGGDGLIGAARMEDVIRMSLGYPADRSKWSQDMIDKFNKTVKEAQLFKTTDGLTAIVSGSTMIIAGATGDVTVLSDKVTATGASVTQTVYHEDGSYEKDTIKGGIDKLGWSGKLQVKDKDGKWAPLQHKADETKLIEVDDGHETKRIGTIASIGASWTGEAALLHGEAKGESGILSGEASYSVGKAEGHASIQAGLYATSVDENGNVTYHLEPGVDAKIGASVSLFEAEASGQIGVDNLNLHGKADVAVLKGSLEAEGQLGFVDGKLAAHVSADAEAILAEASAEGGVNIGGIDTTVKGSVNVGIGAHADVGYHDGKFKADLGLSVGVGASVSIEVDVGGFVDNVVDKGKEVVGAIQDFGECLFSLF